MILKYKTYISNMSTNKVEAGFVQAQSDNLPKVDSFKKVVFDYLGSR